MASLGVVIAANHHVLGGDVQAGIERDLQLRQTDLGMVVLLQHLNQASSQGWPCVPVDQGDRHNQQQNEDECPGDGSLNKFGNARTAAIVPYQLWAGGGLRLWVC